jgi:NADPH2:quinone reductase
MLGYVTDPAAPGGLVRGTFDEPVPAVDEVVVEVRAFAVNRGEIHLLSQRAEGWRPGQDVAGVVVTACASGQGPAVGTRVAGLADGGGWAERVPVRVNQVAPIPDNVSFAEAAALPVAGLTALRTLRAGGPTLGRSVLVTGASGGVGTFAIQLARAGGATVTALVSRPERAPAAEAAGARHVLTSLAGAGPFDIALDGVGGPVLVDVVHSLAPGGTAIAYGVSGGTRESPLSFWDFAGAPLAKVSGFFIFKTDVSTFHEDLGLLATMVGDGRLQPQVGDARDWSEAPAAVAGLRERRATGKVVCLIGGQGEVSRFHRRQRPG